MDVDALNQALEVHRKGDAFYRAFVSVKLLFRPANA
jgi:hypothetical protein